MRLSTFIPSPETQENPKGFLVILNSKRENLDCNGEYHIFGNRLTALLMHGVGINLFMNQMHYIVNISILYFKLYDIVIDCASIYHAPTFFISF